MVQPSPYTPASPAFPVFGRDDSFERAAYRLDLLTMGEAMSHAMVQQPHVERGVRGIGKTSLLRQVQRMAHERGVVTIWVAVDARNSLLDELFRGLGETTEQHGWDTPGPQSWFDRLAAANVHGVKDVLKTMADRARSESNAGMAIFIDDIHQADQQGLRVLAFAWQELQSKAPALPMAFFAAGLPSSVSVISDAAGFAERYDYTTLTALGPDASQRALVEPASNLGVSWDPQALKAAVLRSEGHPLTLQEIGDVAWTAAGRPEPGGVIGLDHVQVAFRAMPNSEPAPAESRAQWSRPQTETREPGIGIDDAH